MKKVIICPICNKQLKYLNNSHLRVHGYSSEQEFHKDYPGFQMRSEEVKVNTTAHLSTVNSNSELQSAKGRKGWTDERRKLKSDEMKHLSYRVHHSPEYAEARKRIYQNNYRGSRKTYTTRDGRVLNTRSKIERFIAYYLDANEIDYTYEELEIPYVREDGTSHLYIPDFYVASHNLIIEGKSKEYQTTSISLNKRQASIDQGYNYVFVSESDIHNYKVLNEALGLE